MYVTTADATLGRLPEHAARGEEDDARRRQCAQSDEVHVARTLPGVGAFHPLRHYGVGQGTYWCAVRDATPKPATSSLTRLWPAEKDLRDDLVSDGIPGASSVVPVRLERLQEVAQPDEVWGKR